MKCDLCDSPAVVHEVTVKGGVKQEVHLCEDHAQELGYPIPGHQPINQLLTQFVIHQGKKGKAKRKSPTCDDCGLTFAQFRKSGTLGCPSCYKAFEDKLSPIIGRAQNAGTHHSGKVPIRSGGSIDRQAEIQRLLKELDVAVSAEQFERAADLRDRLKSIEASKRKASEIAQRKQQRNNAESRRQSSQGTDGTTQSDVSI